MKIRTRGNQVFNVPNDEEGHKFLELLRKFKNRGWYYRARGRGSRKEHGGIYSLPQEHAEWLAVYVSPAKDKQHLPDVAPYPKHKEPQPLMHLNPATEIEVSTAVPIFVPPQAVTEIEVAEWSEPIAVGNQVGVTNGGQAYNADVHGASMQGYGGTVGVALEGHQGSIGEGEATVAVQLDYSDEPKTNMAFYEGMDLSAFCGCDEEAGFKCPDHNGDPEPEENDDEVELTPEELGYLQEILKASHFLASYQEELTENLKSKLS